MKILVTGAGALLGQGIIKSLQGSTLKPYIVAVDPAPGSAGLYWANRAEIIPLATDPHYGDAIADLLKREHPDAVLIGTDVELKFFAAQRAALEQAFNTHILVSSPEVIAIADDKWLTYQFLKDNGFPYPHSCLPDDPAALEALLDAVGFPLIVKPRVGARSVGVHLVHDRTHLTRALAEVPQAIIQECVATSAQEYTAGVLYFNGASRASIVMRRDLRDGNTYRAYVEPYPELNAAVCAFANHLKPYGPVNFQFRLDTQGPTVFEINGRFSGTTPLRMHASFNEVEMALRYIVLGEAVVQPAVRSVIIMRHWSETVVAPSTYQRMIEARMLAPDES